MKVLILSHNPVSTHQSMGKTMLSMFSAFDREELCQLYIYPTRPDVDVCRSYVRITDMAALKSVFTRRVRPEQILPVSDRASEDERTGIYTSGKNRNYSRELIRDLVWALSPWYRKALKDWLDAEKPTHLFVAPGRGKFLYNMALRIAKDRDLPVFTYICDDYYGLEMPASRLGKIWKRLLCRKTRQLMRATTQLISVCDELSEEYAREFGCSAITLMTGGGKSVSKTTWEHVRSGNLTYMGNVSLGRYHSLTTIGRTVDRINQEQGTRYQLNIYSGDVTPEAERELTACKCVRMLDFVCGKAYEAAFREADLLIHTEDFEREHIDRVKHSVSTKIAETLGSGIPMLAYGPEQVASMGHLIRNNCCFAATAEKDLYQVLLTALQDEDARLEKIRNALQTAEKYHNTAYNSKKLYELFQGAKTDNERKDQ